MKMSAWSLACQQSVFFMDITVKNIYQRFTHKMAAKASWHWNYVTLTLCIGNRGDVAVSTRAEPARSDDAKNRGTSNQPTVGAVQTVSTAVRMRFIKQAFYACILSSDKHDRPRLAAKNVTEMTNDLYAANDVNERVRVAEWTKQTCTGYFFQDFKIGGWNIISGG